MQIENKNKVRNFLEYLPEGIKFHKLKSDGLAKFIFLVVLIIQIAANFLQYKVLDVASSQDIYSAFSSLVSSGEAINVQSVENALYTLLSTAGVSLIILLVSNFFYSVYMFSFIAEKTGRDCSFKASFKRVFKYLFRLILLNICFGITVGVGLSFFIVPGILLYIMFIFSFCYVVDLRSLVFDSMNNSYELTAGKKKSIFSVLVGYFALIKLPQILFLGGGSFGAACIASFFSIIGSLILQRFIVLIYLDIEYGASKQK